jgi:hypothetical protein
MLHVICGYDYRITNDVTYYQSYDGPALNYSTSSFKTTEIQIFPNGLLFQNAITACEASVQRSIEHVQLLLRGEGLRQDVFDLFAAAFYLVTRYEEYLPFIADRHNRFEASQSVLFKHGLLERPLINEWAEDLKQTFSKTHAGLPTRAASYHYKITIDVDQAFAFKNRGVVINAYALLKNSLRVNATSLSAQVQTIRNKRKDPFDTFSYLKKLKQAYGFSLLYFINAGFGTKYDKNLPLTNRHFKELVTDLASYAVLGLHPSYYSDKNLHKKVQEKNALERAINKTVTISRQHYLKLHLPITYRHLIAIDIQEDYSMGYASHPGFRAGTCTPFRWFDLEEDKATTLLIYPITYMEGTFAQYLRLSAKEALQRMNELTQTVKRHNGCHISIWHNHTVNDAFDWKGWKTVFEQNLENIINPEP